MRECQCGCGRSLEGTHINTMLTPECRRRRQIERKRAERKADRARLRNQVVNDRGEPMRAQNVLCKVCYGQPDARAPGRIQDRLPVLRADGRCRGCGEPPGEARRIEPVCALRSSAGMALIHAVGHG